MNNSTTKAYNITPIYYNTSYFYNRSKIQFLYIYFKVYYTNYPKFNLKNCKQTNDLIIKSLIGTKIIN